MSFATDRLVFAVGPRTEAEGSGGGAGGGAIPGWARPKEARGSPPVDGLFVERDVRALSGNE